MELENLRPIKMAQSLKDILHQMALLAANFPPNNKANDNTIALLSQAHRRKGPDRRFW